MRNAVSGTGSDENSSKSGFFRRALAAAGFAALSAGAQAESPVVPIKTGSKAEVSALKEDTKDKANKTISGLSVEELGVIQDNSKYFSYKGGQEDLNAGKKDKAIYDRTSNTLIFGNKNAALAQLDTSLLNKGNPSHGGQGMNMGVNGINSEFQKLFGDSMSGIEMKNGKIIVNVGQQFNPDGSSSCVVLGRIGAAEKAMLAGCGYQITPNMQIFAAGERLTQDRNFGATKKPYEVSQDKLGVAFRFIQNNDLIKAVELKAEYSKS